MHRSASINVALPVDVFGDLLNDPQNLGLIYFG